MPVAASGGFDPERSGAMSIFCSQEMAARLEQDEVDKLVAGIEAARRRNPGGGFFAEAIAGGRAIWGGPHSPLNKIAGLGFGGPAAPNALAAIEAAYRARASDVRVELATLGDPEVGRRLTRRGYQLTGFENVLGLRLSPAMAASLAQPSGGEIEIERVEKDEDAAWLDVVVDGFAAADTQGAVTKEEYPREILAEVIADLNAGADYIRYLARIGGQDAGGASMRVVAGIAQMSGAATLPGFRRRGVQSALVARRLADAAAAGCDLAVVTTAPGTKSQQNAQKQGFELLYSRAILLLPGAIAQSRPA
jgi:ribosomal protein S18 acetylase RimI-like enzyme